jgi:hypothetical protein
MDVGSPVAYAGTGMPFVDTFITDFRQIWGRDMRVRNRVYTISGLEMPMF